MNAWIWGGVRKPAARRAVACVFAALSVTGLVMTSSSSPHGLVDDRPTASENVFVPPAKVTSMSSERRTACVFSWWV